MTPVHKTETYLIIQWLTSVHTIKKDQHLQKKHQKEQKTKENPA